MRNITDVKLADTTEFMRKKTHARCDKLEILLQEINDCLETTELDLIHKFTKNKYPLILVLGSPRCGTTLFMQWLASCGQFSYPTNLLSRFYAVPYIGAKIQLMLTTFDFNGELSDFNQDGSFKSRLGKTRGVLAPHEFSYFWRKFFNIGEINKLSDSQVKSFNPSRFLSEIAAIESVFDKPLAMKGGLISWDLPLINSIVDKVLFVHIQRTPIYNIQSLLKARLDYYGDVRAWYSYKPPEYEYLKHCSPIEQVVGQIYLTNQVVEKNLSDVCEHKKISIDYDDFCNNPKNVFDQIMNKCEMQGYIANREYKAPESFLPSNKMKLSDEEISQIHEAYYKITGTKLII